MRYTKLMPRVAKIPFPPESQLYAVLRNGDYRDAFEAGLHDPSLPPADIFARLMRATPAWVETLVRLRNRIVSLLGLKPVDALASIGPSPAKPCAPGDRLSIFTVRSVDANEIVVGIDDSHLDVRMSCLKRASGSSPRYVLTTLVRTHNTFGKIYMLPVGPFHRLIVRFGMQRVDV